MFWNIFNGNPRGFKTIVLMVILLVLCIIPPAINADVETIDAIDEEHTLVIPQGHGLHGLRGGIVFSPEDTQGFGYTHEEVLFNLGVD